MTSFENDFTDAFNSELQNIAGVNSGPLERPGQPVEVATGVIFL